MRSLNKRDKKIIWHPFTQEKLSGLPLAIHKAQGSYLYDENNKKYIDLISSWWVNLHGHANPVIAEAIYHQALQLEHVIFAGFTHEPAVTLCEMLQQTLPSSLSKFFFSDNGSTSVETALKIAYQYWVNQGESEKNLFLSFDGGYHGDTFGAMSVGANSGFHDVFKDLFFKVLTLPYPDINPTSEKNQSIILDILDNYLQKYKHKISAFILEPLIQGAGGMRMACPDLLNKILTKVRSENILIIYDEIMTGFYRTGTLFALDQLTIKPDILCLSKGITGGFLPLALTITTEKIYKAFLSDDIKQAFLHGHSYTANPLACAAAIASFKLLLNPDTQNSIRLIHQAHQTGIDYLKKSCPTNIKNTRLLGTICAFEFESHYTNQELKEIFLNQGLLLRPLGNTLYILPPYSTTVADLELAYQKISQVFTV